MRIFLSPIFGISALTKLFSARKMQQITSNLLIITMTLFTTPLAWAVSVPPHVPPAVLEEFTSVEAIKLRDAQGTSTPPSIPKSWKLISVSNGEKSNSNNLWFQDNDGSVYLLQGFTSKSKYFIHENVYKIPAK